MATTESILEQARRKGLATPRAGMSVPPGYFEDFNTRMAASLPYRPDAEKPDAVPEQAAPTLWKRVRPFVYMAAMFAGIWLMLQMFAMIGMNTTLKPLDQNPVLTAALSDDDFMFDYLYDDYSSYELFDEVIEDTVEDVPQAEMGAGADNIVLPDSTI